MAAQSLEGVLRIFQLCGMFPADIDANSKHLSLQWKSAIYNVVRGLITLALISYEIYSKPSLFNSDGTFMESFLDAGKLIVSRCTTVVFAFELLFKREAILEYFKHLDQFDEFVKRNFNNKHSHGNRKIYAELMLIGAFSAAMCCFSYLRDDSTLISAFLDVFKRAQFYQVNLFILLIDKRVLVINKCLCQLEQSNKENHKRISIVSHMDWMRKGRNESVIALRESFSTAWRASLSLNDMFHWTLPSLVTVSFFDLLDGVYSTIVAHQYNNNRIDATYFLIISCSELFMIHLLADTSSDINEKVRALHIPLAHLLPESRFSKGHIYTYVRASDAAVQCRCGK